MKNTEEIECGVCRYYSILAMGFVGLLLTANVIGPKPLQFGIITIPAGLLIFPLTYLLGVVITEVYGFKKSRLVIWAGLICNLFMVAACQLAISLPYDPSWQFQASYSQTLGTTSRVMLASVFTYFVGELVNSYVVAKLKQQFAGKYFWLRGLCGNWLGEGIETALFIPLVFYELPVLKLFQLASFYYIFKVVYALTAMPLVQMLVRYLVRVEQPTRHSIGIQAFQSA